MAGVAGALLPWLHWSCAGVEGGPGPPPRKPAKHALMLEPKWLVAVDDGEDDDD